MPQGGCLLSLFLSKMKQAVSVALLTVCSCETKQLELLFGKRFASVASSISSQPECLGLKSCKIM